MFLIEKGRKSPICRECKALHSKAKCPKRRQSKAREILAALRADFEAKHGPQRWKVAL